MAETLERYIAHNKNVFWSICMNVDDDAHVDISCVVQTHYNKNENYTDEADDVIQALVDIACIAIDNQDLESLDIHLVLPSIDPTLDSDEKITRVYKQQQTCDEDACCYYICIQKSDPYTTESPKIVQKIKLESSDLARASVRIGGCP